MAPAWAYLLWCMLCFIVFPTFAMGVSIVTGDQSSDTRAREKRAPKICIYFMRSLPTPTTNRSGRTQDRTYIQEGVCVVYAKTRRGRKRRELAEKVTGIRSSFRHAHVQAVLRCSCCAHLAKNSLFIASWAGLAVDGYHMECTAGRCARRRRAS